MVQYLNQKIMIFIIFSLRYSFIIIFLILTFIFFIFRLVIFIVIFLLNIIYRKKNLKEYVIKEGQGSIYGSPRYINHRL